MIDFIKIVVDVNHYIIPEGVLYEHPTLKNSYYIRNTYSFSKIVITITNSSVILFGCLTYFSNDNNFEYANHKIAIQNLSKLLNLDVSEGIVHIFEFGAVIKVPFPTKEYLNNAIHLKYHHREFYKNGIIFRNYNGGGTKIKIYDAAANVRNKWSSRMPKTRERLGALGISKTSYYLKFEINYKAVKGRFKEWGIVKVKKLLEPSFIQLLGKNLLKYYLGIEKLIQPSSSDDKTHTILLEALISACIENGSSPKERFKEQLDKRRHLSTNEKKARRKRYNNWMKSIQQDIDNPYDISMLLRLKLNTYLYCFQKGILREPPPKFCLACGEPIIDRKEQAKYCCNRCKNHFHSTLRKIKPTLLV